VNAVSTAVENVVLRFRQKREKTLDRLALTDRRHVFERPRRAGLAVRMADDIFSYEKLDHAVSEKRKLSGRNAFDAGIIHLISSNLSL
jgi:hypothetical protein